MLVRTYGCTYWYMVRRLFCNAVGPRVKGYTALTWKSTSLAHARLYETKPRAGTVLTFEFPVVIARGEELCGVLINAYVPPSAKDWIPLCMGNNLPCPHKIGTGFVRRSQAVPFLRAIIVGVQRSFVRARRGNRERGWCDGSAGR